VSYPLVYVNPNRRVSVGKRKTGNRPGGAGVDPDREAFGEQIDLASNNHQRFVRGQIASGQDFLGYEHEQWVRLQDCQGARWTDLIDLGRTYNTHILHVIGCTSEEGKRATCRVGR
jgi:hypothetical protein